MTENIENTQPEATQPEATQPEVPRLEAAPQPTPQPTPQPKRLVRPREGRKLAGVCQGVANYAGVDVTVVRLITVGLCLFGLGGLVLYVAGVILMPEE